MSVFSVLIHDFAVNILCFLAVCVKSFGHRLELSWKSQFLALPSLQNTGYFGEVRAFDKWGTTEIYHRLIDIMEIARSWCPNELVWQELYFAEDMRHAYDNVLVAVLFAKVGRGDSQSPPPCCSFFQWVYHTPLAVIRGCKTGCLLSGARPRTP